MIPFISFPENHKELVCDAHNDITPATSHSVCSSQLFVFFIECRDKICPHQPSLLNGKPLVIKA